MGEPAGHWLRVSSTGQDETSQIPDNEQWIKAHGYDVKETYTLHSYSAFKGTRKFDKAWAKVLTDIKNGVISVLVVWKTDRIDRKLNTLHMLKQVVDAGGRVEFTTQPHLNDLTTMAGRIALKIQEEIAYAESKDKSDRVRAKHANLRRAKSLIGRPPFGYYVVQAEGIKKLKPTTEGLKYVPQIFRRVADGQSLMAVAKWLDSEGVKPPQANSKKWSPKSLAQLIRRTTYIGERQDASGYVLEVEPLVDVKLWDDANKRLSAAPIRGKRGPKIHEQALLVGALKCGNCGGSMYRVFCGRHPYRQPYYRCYGKLPQPKGCGASMVSLKLLDAIVDDAMSADLTFVMTTKFIPGHNYEKEIKVIERELFKLPTRGLPEEDEDAERARLRAEKRRLLALPTVPDNWDTAPVMENGEPITHAAKWQASDLTGKREILKEKRITFQWGELDGERHPEVTIVPLWVAESAESA
jgi:DNA invertase Pin-like site-specific DNA recombinase